MGNTIDYRTVKYDVFIRLYKVFVRSFIVHSEEKDVIEEKRYRLALIVNPYAGIGGEAALKGSDAAIAQALAYSDKLRTPERCLRFLQALQHDLLNIDFVTGSGIMGEDYLKQLGASIVYVYPIVSQPTTAADSKTLANNLVEQKPDMLIFVGGDGTARDMVDSVGLSVPCLGVPGGVKMQSAVFAISPEAAAEVVKQLLQGELLRIAEQDVRDIDEQALRTGRVQSRYYGSLLVPAEAEWVQALKQGSIVDDSLILDEIAEHLTDIMWDEEKLMLAGPGSSIAYWMQSLQLPNTLIGFDAIKNGELIQADLTANDILQLMEEHPDLYVVITPTGNQGFLLGRGNQQLNPSVIKKLNKSQWLIIASQTKLHSLEKKPLLVDTNDVKLDQAFAGLYPVITGWRHQVLYPVASSYSFINQPQIISHDNT